MRGANDLGRPGRGSNAVMQLSYVKPAPSVDPFEPDPGEWVSGTGLPAASATQTCVVSRLSGPAGRFVVRRVATGLDSDRRRGARRALNPDLRATTAVPAAAAGALARTCF